MINLTTNLIMSRYVTVECIFRSNTSYIFFKLISSFSVAAFYFGYHLILLFFLYALGGSFHSLTKGLC